MYLSTLILLCSGLVHAAPHQVPFEASALAKPRKLHGRFLHITDMHPDPFYQPKTSEKTSCHRKKGKKKKNVAGYYGQPYSDCDSPFRLTNLTLDFIEKKWASEIDFVIWTGDNARHDNDRKLPRTPAEIYELNRAVAAKMNSAFTSRGIPVIPSLGELLIFRNNDVWREYLVILIFNILNIPQLIITSEFSSIWKAFIPFPYLQIFQRGAYYAVEVIPDAVAVISLNTMYFYDSNKAVGGCAFKDREDAGNLEFDWLEVQLKGFRARGMQVWLSGHVPPSSGNYFPECYVRYVELALRFQDTIVGHLFGAKASDLEIFEPAKAKNNNDLFDALIADFAAMPKPKDIDYHDYAVINVSPSVVPNPYLPSFRVFSYNITGTASSFKDRKPGHRRGSSKDKRKQCKLDMYRETWKCQLNETWHSDPESPSRSNRLWTPLGYAQYYIPHLEEGNKTHKPSFKLEYVTYPAEALGGKEGFHPVPPKNLPSTLKNRHTAYGLEDMTIGSWVALARRMSNSKKLSALFKKNMYMT
ncbi:RFX-type winged-helix domain-containing protein [Mycena sanguinolenta]|uniref:RFX-type winged-helix domain-containing protein n=1 Tax=Mycena sanguinolenta TaxID=230812 RepID=A0A8H6YBF5_9AGAR|nr:RFX-type winged-helix domain-containing protein [Mycena sanguinolenta]